MRRATGHLLELIAAGALIASVMPLGAKLWWGFDLAAHFRVQYVAFDVLLVALLAWRRQWLWSGALLACAVWSATWVAPYLPLGSHTAASAAAAAPPLKLLSANVLFHNHEMQPLLDLVSRESPDVVLLVEYTHEWAANVDALRNTYAHRVEVPGFRADGLALFSRFPLESVEVLNLDFMPAIEARVRTPQGALTLFGIHLRSPTTPRRSARRDGQLESLAQIVAGVEGPVAIMGDLNITPYSPFYVDFLKRTGFTDTRAGRTLSPSWPTYLPVLGIPIDHCIVSRDVTIVAHRGLPPFGSDHSAILAELALPGSHSGTTTPASPP